MATLQAHGTELHRYFSTAARGLLSVRSDGTTLVRRVGDGWKVYRRKRADVTMETWTEYKRQKFASLPAWKRECTELPALHELEQWVSDSVCESPTGHTVEPDGAGPDGVPSWLVCLGLI